MNAAGKLSNYARQFASGNVSEQFKSALANPECLMLVFVVLSLMLSIDNLGEDKADKDEKAQWIPITTIVLLGLMVVSMLFDLGRDMNWIHQLLTVAVIALGVFQAFSNITDEEQKNKLTPLFTLVIGGFAAISFVYMTILGSVN